MNVFDFLFENSFYFKKDLVVGPAEKRSYGGVFQESLRLAYYLRRNIGQGKNVILTSANSLYFITAYLGILKSGNVCIPLNPQVEKEVFEFIKVKTNPQIIFFSENVLQYLDPAGVECVTETKLKEIITEEKGKLDWEPDFDESKLAAIMFTSGSTALPKGVMLSHRNIIANTKSIIKALRISEKDTMMVVLPFYYCYGLSLLNTHIRVGGSLVLNNNFIFFSQTIQLLNRFEVTGFAGVPSHFQLLLRKTDLFREIPVPSLRYVTQAGGRLHTTFINEFRELFPDVKFFVMYGQTEATARLSVLPPEILNEKIGSIGKGIDGVEMKVVNEEGNPVFPGETGEIIVRGDNIMMGYFDDTDGTNQTIINGWLHTGDLATIDNDDYIYITARKKEIIKIGGIRISPREIEEVIVKMKGVVDCSVEAVFDGMLGEAIKANVVVNDYGKSITPEDLKKYCSTKLASYKIPTYVFFDETMEISPSGKKLRRA